jgi:ribosomal-protein-serine acetyltransferase
MVGRSRAELMPWMPWAEASDATAFRAFVGRVVAERNRRGAGGAAFAILIDGAFAGCVDLHDEIPRLRSAAIGYWLGTPYVGQGWMTKSVVAVTASGFRDFGLRRIEILADAENVRSRRVAERAGFALEAIRARRLADGRARDEAVYVRTVPESIADG